MKTLILAYDFPPYVSVGGLRPYSWYKYFKEFGIDPVVVTRQWGNKYGNSLDYIAASESKKTIVEETEYGKIIRAPYFPNLANKILLKYGEKNFRILRKAISAFYEIFQWIFFVGPKVQLYFAAKKYLQNNSVDVIIATGEPFVLFRYASLLSKKFNIPWIADYRDPWSQNKSRSKNVFLKRWFSYLEKKNLKDVSLIITVSNFVKKHIVTLIKNKEVVIISNGYDDEAINKTKQIKQGSNKLNIAFVGSIYKWHPVKSFLKVFAKFIKETKEPNIEINFYGVNNKEDIIKDVDSISSEIGKYINFYARMPNEKLLKILSTQNVLLLFNYYSYMGTKIYDYLALKRKIIFCYKNDEEANKLKAKYYDIEELDSENKNLQEEVLKETNSGIIVENSQHLFMVLKELYSEFLEKKQITCNSVNTEQYSRKIRVKKLAKILLSIE